MTGPVVGDFLAHGVDETIRRQLLEAIAARSQGEQYVTYNVFNVRIDHDRRLAVVEDVLDADREEAVALSEFVRLLNVRRQANRARGS